MKVNPAIPIRRLGDIYIIDLYLLELLPPAQRTARTFHWTVDLAVEQASSDPIPTHAAPLQFQWEPSF